MKNDLGKQFNNVKPEKGGKGNSMPFERSIPTAKGSATDKFKGSDSKSKDRSSQQWKMTDATKRAPQKASEGKLESRPLQQQMTGDDTKRAPQKASESKLEGPPTMERKAVDAAVFTANSEIPKKHRPKVIEMQAEDWKLNRDMDRKAFLKQVETNNRIRLESVKGDKKLKEFDKKIEIEKIRAGAAGNNNGTNTNVSEKESKSRKQEGEFHKKVKELLLEQIKKAQRTVASTLNDAI